MELTPDDARGQFIQNYVTVPLKLWMARSTLAEIERSFGTKVAKLGECDAARNSALRMVPELAFALGLPLQIIRAMKKGTEQEQSLPGVGLCTLSACVRGGLDVAEKLALRRVLNMRSSRVAVHRRYACMPASIAPAAGAEDLVMAIGRIRNALLALG